MPKVVSIFVKICDWITKISVYLAIFLLPIFFLPWTSDFLDFNKQTVLILLSFVAIFAWMVKVLISGKFTINKSKTHIVAGILFLIYLLATIFSVNKYGSFWGWPQASSESLLTLACLAIFYFLVAGTFSKENILNGLKFLSVSALVAELFGVLQLFGLYLFPFAKSISFNSVGTIGSLGFFVAILLPVAMAMLIFSKKWLKILFAAQLVLSTVILFLIHYPIVWWAVAVGSVALIIFGIAKRKFFDGRWMALPIFFLVVSVFFAVRNPQIPWIGTKSNEVFLSQKASLDISLQAIKAMPIFGSGPGTFSYDFLKFKSPNFSQTSLWNITFNQAGTKALSDLATIGVLGLIAFVIFLLLPIFYGTKFLIFKKTPKEEILTLGILTSLITTTVVYFLYNFNVVLIFLSFFITASLIGLVSLEKKEYELKPSSLQTIAVTFIFTLLFIFGIGILLLDGQRYVAEVKYFRGTSAFKAGQQDAGVKNMEQAAALNNSSDLYFRNLAQIYLTRAQSALKNISGNPTDDTKKKIQTLAGNAVNAAKMATDLNPNSEDDWFVRGYVYQSLFGIVTEAPDWAVKSYTRAIVLNPNDPYVIMQKGLALFSTSLGLSQDKQTQKTQFLQQSKTQLEKAVAINPNYSNALYYLGLVYDALGQKNDAINAFKKVQKLNPDSQEIQKILTNLNAGLPAIQQTTTPLPSTQNGGVPAIPNSTKTPTKK